MNHKKSNHSFGRKPGPRKALIRNLVDALVEHGRIKTTLPKAKELRKYVEKAITKGKRGDVHCRRILLADYPNKNTVKTIVDDLSVRFKDRPGGYTRILKLGERPGDSAKMAYIEFTDFVAPEAKSAETVVGDKDAAKTAKALARRHAAKKKRIRQMANASRKRNR